jgi:hypothetical protein
MPSYEKTARKFLAKAKSMKSKLTKLVDKLNRSKRAKTVGKSVLGITATIVSLIALKKASLLLQHELSKTFVPYLEKKRKAKADDAEKRHLDAAIAICGLTYALLKGIDTKVDLALTAAESALKAAREKMSEKFANATGKKAAAPAV